MNPREEIKEIANTLSQWKHDEGYVIPEGYFNNVSNLVMDRVAEEEKLEPYFEALPDRVMDRIKQEEDNSNHSKTINIKPLYKYLVAAAMLMVAGTLIWSNQEVQPVAPVYSMNEYTQDLEYIEEEMSLEEILDSEFIEDELLDEILVSGEEYYSADESAEDILYEVGDELLEEFL